MAQAGGLRHEYKEFKKEPLRASEVEEGARGAVLTHRAILVFGRASFVSGWIVDGCWDRWGWETRENSRCVKFAESRDAWGRDAGAVSAGDFSFMPASD